MLTSSEIMTAFTVSDDKFSVVINGLWLFSVLPGKASYDVYNANGSRFTTWKYSGQWLSFWPAEKTTSNFFSCRSLANKSKIHRHSITFLHYIVETGYRDQHVDHRFDVSLWLGAQIDTEIPFRRGVWRTTKIYHWLSMKLQLKCLDKSQLSGWRATDVWAHFTKEGKKECQTKKKQEI